MTPADEGDADGDDGHRQRDAGAVDHPARAVPPQAVRAQRVGPRGRLQGLRRPRSARDRRASAAGPTAPITTSRPMIVPKIRRGCAPGASPAQAPLREHRPTRTADAAGTGRRRIGGASGGRRPGASDAPAIADPRVEVGVGDVDQQVGQHEGEHRHQHDALDDGIVARPEGLDAEAADPRPGEDRTR